MQGDRRTAPLDPTTPNATGPLDAPAVKVTIIGDALLSPAQAAAIARVLVADERERADRA